MGRLLRHPGLTFTSAALLLVLAAVLPPRIILLPSSPIAPSDQAEILSGILLRPSFGALVVLLVGVCAAALVRVLTRLRRTTSCAAEASLVKARFLRALSERIRTPLTGLVGMSDLLATSDLPSPQNEFAAVAQESAHSMLHMLNNLLEYARLDDGTIQPQDADFDLHGLLEDTADRFALQAHEKGLKFSCCIAPDVPQVVRGDPVLFGRLITNLASNAVRFTSQGEVVLTARLLHDYHKNYSISFDIRDTGIGITAEKRAQLMRRSILGSDASDSSGGLGVAIAQLIANLFHGTLEIHSELGKGSVFWTVLRLGHAASPIPALQRLPLPSDFLAGVLSANASIRKMVIWKFATLGVRVIPLEENTPWPPQLQVVFCDSEVPPVLRGVPVVPLCRKTDEKRGGVGSLEIPLRQSAASALLTDWKGDITGASQLSALARNIAAHQGSTAKESTPSKILP